MASISTLRSISTAADATFYAAREVYYSTLAEVAVNYSNELYASIGRLEDAYRAARIAMENANAELEHAVLVSVGVRREPARKAA
jgi:hypothetical protein